MEARIAGIWRQLGNRAALDAIGGPSRGMRVGLHNVLS